MERQQKDVEILNQQKAEEKSNGKQTVELKYEFSRSGLPAEGFFAMAESQPEATFGEQETVSTKKHTKGSVQARAKLRFMNNFSFVSLLSRKLHGKMVY